jgi:hypothetical protein
MPTVHKTNRASDVVRFQAAEAGVNMHIQTPIQLEGQTMTPQAIVAVLTGAIQADQDLDAAKAQQEAKLQARNAAVKTALALLAALQRYAQATYGTTSPNLKDFGFTLVTPPKKTVKVKAAAVDLSAETRKLRQTMGSRQKAHIKAEPAVAAPPPAPTVTTAPAGATGAGPAKGS